MSEKVRVGIVGCGAISEIYLKNLTGLFREVEVLGICGRDALRAGKRAQDFSLPRRYASYADLLADDDIEMVLNLTTPLAHFETTRAAIAAGKHVYSEKPLAPTFAEGIELVHLAAEARVRLGCAPDTPLGAGVQTCRKLVDDGYVGKVIAFSANLVKRGVEARHPNPDFLYQPGGGPLLDMGPYYLAALVHILGPVAEVSGMHATPFAERIITSQPRHGQTIRVNVPTHVNSLLRLESGALGVFIATFDVHRANLPHFEIYGENGTLSVPYPNDFSGPIRLFRPENGEFLLFPPMFGYAENSRGLGLADMCKAVRIGRPHRANSEIALHTLEVIDAITRSAAEGCHVEVATRCERPAPMANPDILGILD